MKKRYVLPLLLLLLVAQTGCEADLDNDYEAPEDQPVLFEYRHVNHAWGYTEQGWLINAGGDVRRYNLPENYIIPDSSGYISLEGLSQNLSQCDSTIQNIGAEDLEYYAGFISGASSGEIRKAENIAADAGSSVLSCYLYDPRKDMYQYIFLASSGDWQQSNDTPEAEILVEWMRSIGVFWLEF